MQTGDELDLDAIEIRLEMSKDLAEAMPYSVIAQLQSDQRDLLAAVRARDIEIAQLRIQLEHWMDNDSPNQFAIGTYAGAE